MINPFVALRDWLQEEILEVEAMQLAIKKIHNLLETEEKLKSKLNKLEEEMKKGEQGQFNFIKSILKNKEIMAEVEKDKENTQQKIGDFGEIIKIVGDNMESQIEHFKNDGTQNYYKYLKIFAIMQKESNKEVREFWTLVKNALNEIAPNAEKKDKIELKKIPLINSKVNLLPVVTLAFNCNCEINSALYDSLKEELTYLIGDKNFSIINIEKGSAIIKIALINDLAIKGIKISKNNKISNEIETVLKKMESKKFVCLGNNSASVSRYNIPDYSKDDNRKELVNFLKNSSKKN